MKIGIIGAGFMARTHYTGWMAIGETVTGVYSPETESAEEFARDTGVTMRTSAAELIAESDVVDVCSPTFTHREYVTAAADAGKPIFCEKPLARTRDDAQEMLSAAARAGVPLGVGQVLRYFSEYAGAAETARSGELGDLAVLRFSRCSFAPANPWYRDDDKSGGVILDLMIHDLDFAQYVAGPVTRVFAAVDTAGRTPGTPGPAPHAYVILTHASGAISHVEGSWRMPKPEFSTSFEIAGSRGLLTYSSADATALTPHLGPAPGAAADGSSTPAVAVAASPVADDPYTAELRAFRDAVVAGTPPPVGGEEGLGALRLALAAIESDRTGMPVEIEEVSR
ncbi:MAG: Gfo/Idh/MocA family oxidoreductase [Spirochaeta sp.]|jgi:predicted dehydrogenase|nr:Gfo/Idh/MocA family oxidoreductase [Spirochaeta sp.]